MTTIQKGNQNLVEHVHIVVNIGVLITTQSAL